MRPTVSASEKALVARVELLERKLAELTGTIALAHLLPESLVTIDDRPAEFETGDALVDVGMREIAIAHTGCEPVRKIIAVLPDQRVPFDAALSCAENNGNLHVRISGLGADAYVDGESYKIAARDLDVPIAPGRHHLVVRHLGVTIEDTWIVVPERGTAQHHVAVPYRARRLAITASGVSGIAASSDGERTLFAGFGFGYLYALRPLDRSIAELQLDVGKTIPHVEGLKGSPLYVAGLGVFRLLGPIWQRRAGDALLTLDVDPISVRLIRTETGSELMGDNVSKYYLMFGSATFGVDWSGGRLAVVAWPGGVAGWRSHSLDTQRASYCGSVTMSLSWPLLGL
jgi:hypothetical protein